MVKTKKCKPVVAATGSANGTNTNITIQNSSLNTIQWYPSQKLLFDARQPEDTIVISKDIPPGDGPKAFTWFKTFHDLNTFLESNKDNSPHFNEVIIDNKNYPTYMFFDLDREIFADDEEILEDIKGSREFMIVVFMFKLKEFLKQFYNIDIRIAQHAQIAYTDTSSKLSAHIKVNIKFNNLIDHKIFATNLDKYIRSNVFTTDEDRDRLMFYKPDDKHDREPMSICDMSSYGNFKNMRMLYSSKLKKNNTGRPLVPFRYDETVSSLFIKDHLVQVYDGNEQPVIATLKNLYILNIPVDYDDIPTNFSIQQLHLNPSTIEQVKSYSKPQSTTVARIPHDALDDVVKYLESKEIEKLLQIDSMRIRESIHIQPTIVRYIIDKQIKHVCPIAKRAHRHNHSYFDFYYKTNTIRYGCFHDNCKISNHLIKIKLRSAKDAIKQLSIMNNHNTLHCCKDIIKWDQLYDHQVMNPYPLKPLTVVRAGMGLGKTKALIYDYIPKYCNNPSTKCLMITYQQVLAKKYASELEEFGFVNYLNCEYDIYAPKVIVCLDSLPRVKTTNFDFVFIDEALSVFLHFNSRFIKQSSRLCAQLEMVLLQARYIMFLDAVIDNHLTYDIIQYFADKKNAKPYYIFNTHIRVPQIVQQRRKAHLIVNSSSTSQAAMKLTIFKQALKALTDRNKVVIASSTKRFTEEILSYINSNWPINTPTPKVILYNSDNTCDISSVEINTQWQEYDALIYSPSITAGISFEALYFDQMIAYIENSFYTPPVDIILQQLFRVRQLRKGLMTLYINNCLEFEHEKYHVIASDIDSHLNNDTEYVNKYFNRFNSDAVNFESECKVDATGIRYDTDKLSYKILRGILMNRNKSLTMFVDVLAKTLEEDYKVQVKRSTYSASEDFIRKAIKLLKEMRMQLTKEDISFDSVWNFTEAEYVALEAKEKRGEKLTDIQKQAKWYFKCCMELWKINMNVVDEDFYNNYVGQCRDNSIGSVINKYFKARRYTEMLNHDITQTLTKYRTKMNHLTESKEYNIELYKTKTKEYYTKLVEGQRLLQSMFADQKEFKQQLKLQTLSIKKDAMKTGVKQYIGSLSDDEYTCLIKTFDMPSYEDRKKVLDDDKKLTWFTKGILGEAFEIEINRIENNKNRDTYNCKSIVARLQTMINTYQPDIEDHNGVYTFI